MMMPAAGKYAKNAKGFMKLRDPLPLTPIESTAKRRTKIKTPYDGSRTEEMTSYEMKTIPLNRPKVALPDSKDYRWLSHAAAGPIGLISK